MAIKVATLETEITVNDRKARAQLVDFGKVAQKLGGASTLGQVIGDANSQYGGFSATLGTAKNALMSIPIPAAAAAGAIAGIGAAAYGAGQELFGLAKQGSDLGKSFGSFETKTGLSAAAVSTLSFEANKSGKELGDLQKPLVALNEMLYKAKGGSSDAAASLKSMGVTSYDLETALDQMAKGANDAASGQERLHNIVDILGKKAGPDFISILTKMPDGFKAAQREAERLGVTLSEQDIKAAKEFGREYNVVAEQVKIGTAKFALQYAPQMAQGIHMISDSLARNQNQWTAWGAVVASMITGTVKALSGIASWVVDHPIATRIVLGVGTFGASEAGFAAGMAIDTMGGGAEKYLPKRTHGVALEGGTAAISPDWGSEDDSTGGKKKGGRLGKAADFKLSSEGQALVSAANKLGIKPLDLAMIIGFETGGTYSTSAKNAQGYKGLIQFSPAIQGRYTTPGESFEHQIQNGVVKYFQDRFGSVGRTTAGASLLDLYRTVLGGNPNASLTGTDINGTSPLSGVRDMLRSHKGKALGRFFGGKESNVPGDNWGSEFAGYAKGAEDDQKKKDEDAMKLRELEMKHFFELGQEGYESLIRADERYYQQAEDSGQMAVALQVAKTIHDNKVAMAEAEVAEAERVAKAQVDGTQAAEEANDAWAKARIAADNAVAAADDELSRRRQKLWDDEVERGNRIIATIAAQNDFELDQTIAGEHPAAAEKSDDISDLARAWKELREQMEAVASVQNVAQKAGMMGIDMMHNMADAVGSAIEAWALYGESIGQALKKALAAELAHIAAVATVNALYSTALGFMRLAQWDFVGAGHAFMAAGLWAALAAGTALGAKGLSGGGKDQQKPSANAVGGQQGSSNGGTQATSPYSRSTADAYLSGRRGGSGSELRDLAAEVRQLHQKIGGQRPGDILVTGVRQKPGLVLATATKEVRGNATQGRQLASSLGLK